MAFQKAENAKSKIAAQELAPYRWFCNVMAPMANENNPKRCQQLRPTFSRSLLNTIEFKMTKRSCRRSAASKTKQILVQYVKSAGSAVKNHQQQLIRRTSSADDLVKFFSRCKSAQTEPVWTTTRDFERRRQHSDTTNRPFVIESVANTAFLSTNETKQQEPKTVHLTENVLDDEFNMRVEKGECQERHGGQVKPAWVDSGKSRLGLRLDRSFNNQNEASLASVEFQLNDLMIDDHV